MIEAPFSELDYSSDCLDEFHGFTDEEDHKDGFNDAIEEDDDLAMRLASRAQQYGGYSSGSGEEKHLRQDDLRGSLGQLRSKRQSRK